MSFSMSKAHSVATDGETRTQNAHQNASVIDPLKEHKIVIIEKRHIRKKSGSFFSDSACFYDSKTTGELDS
jgi:hypothetical protein